jgi:hypothetical protein
MREPRSSCVQSRSDLTQIPLHLDHSADAQVGSTHVLGQVRFQVVMLPQLGDCLPLTELRLVLAQEEGESNDEYLERRS